MSMPTETVSGTTAEPQAHATRVTVDRVLDLVVAFTIITSLVGLAAALAGVFHAAQVLLGSLLLTGWYAYRTQRRSALPGIAPRWWHVALLVVVALFFRLPAYHYVLGGQDEGLYVNIAHYIERTGGIEAHDTVKQRLLHTPAIQQYVQDNQVTVDSYLAGVYSRDFKNGKVEFQFYHLLPVWMALFYGIFGSTFGIYALTFFALLSVLFCYRLTLLLTRSHNAALTAGALLALNPLHAFFSKFPVTEVPTLAFSLGGFTLLAAYWSADIERRQQRWLILSVLMFLCLFVTRISGFMYVPFFIALAVATLACDADAQRRRLMQRWAIAATAAYLISVVYGLTWSHSYSHDIYLAVFEPLLGEHWKAGVVVIVVGALLLWLGVAILARKPEWRSRFGGWIAGPLNILLGFIVFVALLIGLLKIYRLAWTSRYASDPWLADKWHLAGGGWQSVGATSLWTLMVYLGPLLVLAFLVLIGRRQVDPRIGFLRWFVAGFFAYALLLQWAIPYGPYYARYLLSELVPYLILFVVCAWSALRVGGGRAALSAALFLSVIYAAALSAAQIGKSEDDGAYQALARLTAPIEGNDLILLNTLDQNGPDTSLLKTPLLYTFGRNVVTVGNAALANPEYLAELDAIYDDLFLISPDPVPPPGFTLLDGVRFRVLAFQPTHFFPRGLVPTQDTVLYLFRLDHAQFPLGSVQSFTPGVAWVQWLGLGWGGAESWGVWSTANHAEMSINPRQLPDVKNGLILQLDARVFVTSAHSQQRVDISVDGVLIDHYSVVYPATILAIQIPISEELLKSPRRIEIDFALPGAVSPEAIGEGDDARQLAIGLIDVSVSANTQADALPSPPSNQDQSALRDANPRH
ncbi:MAG: hypothetical protein ABI132_00265 [Rhodanobacteraceae bacterium]